MRVGVVRHLYRRKYAMRQGRIAGANVRRPKNHPDIAVLPPSPKQDRSLEPFAARCVERLGGEDAPMLLRMLGLA